MSGYRWRVRGVNTSVPAKHSKHPSLVNAFAIGVYRIQRNFEPTLRLQRVGKLRNQRDWIRCWPFALTCHFRGIGFHYADCPVPN
jgi:hypothetical protein